MNFLNLLWLLLLSVVGTIVLSSKQNRSPQSSTLMKQPSSQQKPSIENEVPIESAIEPSAVQTSVQPLETPASKSEVPSMQNSSYEPGEIDSSDHKSVIDCGVNSDSIAATTESETTLINLTEDHRPNFSVEAFKQEFLNSLSLLQADLPESGTAQIYAIALVSMLRSCFLKFKHPETLFSQAKVKTVAELATTIGVPPLLETSLVNLDVLDRISQELGFSLETLFQREDSQVQEDCLSDLLNGYLEALATSEVPAIAYGIYASTSEISSAWQIEHSEAIVKIGFGGDTQLVGGEQGYRTRWLPSEQIEAVPYDVFILGDRSNGISILRQWKVNSPEDARLELDKENFLRQNFILASSSVQDLIRLHLASGAAIETLDQRFTVHLNDAASTLAIVELMRRLIDDYRLEWQQAWRMTQTIFSCTIHHLTSSLSDRYSITMLSRLLPRHLEVIYEINRRFLAEVGAKHPDDIDRIRRLSLIDETEARSLRAVHLICVGSHVVNGFSTFQTQLLQQNLSDFNQQYPGKFKTAVNGISSHRYLLRSNRLLANLLTQKIGEDWIRSFQALDRLEDLTQDDQFCSDWWQVKRDNKQSFASEIYQQTGLAINLNSLFDVQVAPIHEQRQLLNLLHIITLYARLKINSNTDTIQRFTHRSVPRTCIFSGAVVSDRSIDQFVNRLIESIATVINDDADVQGRLQVIVLDEKQSQLRSLLDAAADLSEQIPLATQADFSLNPLRFSLNGASTIGTQTPSNLQLQQTIGTKSVFLFGLTASDAEQLRLKNHDPRHYYSSDPELRQAIDLIASGYFSYKDSRVFTPLVDWLLSDDSDLILADYRSYIDCQERVSKLYQDQKTWTRNAISTTAHMHSLCADRAISNQDFSLTAG